MENQPKGIHKKLLAFQKLGIKLEKTSTNPHFNSKFAGLPEVLEKITKPLNDLGVIILQQPTMTGLETRLIDVETGTDVSCFFPYVEATTPQKLGSNNTYNRRYSLITLLGLPDEDEDGNVASAVDNKKPKYKGGVVDPKSVDTNSDPL